MLRLLLICLFAVLFLVQLLQSLIA